MMAEKHSDLALVNVEIADKPLEYHVKNTVDNYLTCPLCHKLLTDPVQIPVCGHLFCRACLLRFVKKNEECPLCQTRITEADAIRMNTDKRVEKIVLSTEVHCASCKTFMTFKEWPEHPNTCPDAVIKCPAYKRHGCEVKIRRKDQRDHDRTMMKEHLALCKAKLTYLEEKTKCAVTPNEAHDELRGTKFTWKVVLGQMRTRADGTSDSPEFYLYGYSFFLRVSADHHHLYLFSCPGRYDERLKWPFTNADLQLSVADANRGAVLNTNTLRMQDFPRETRKHPAIATETDAHEFRHFLNHNQISEDTKLAISVSWIRK